MPASKPDSTREARIHDEIIVDAYGGSEQAMGWYYYLADHLAFPFKARCVSERSTSPLEKGETITVLAMAPETECEREMIVRIAWHDRTVAVPLIQLMSKSADPETRQAMEDWHYWVGRGHLLIRR